MSSYVSEQEFCIEFGTFTKDNFLRGSDYLCTSDKGFNHPVIQNFIKNTFIGSCVDIRKVGDRVILDIPYAVFHNPDVVKGMLRYISIPYNVAVAMNKTARLAKEQKLRDYINKVLKNRDSDILELDLRLYTNANMPNSYGLDISALKRVLKEFRTIKYFYMYEYSDFDQGLCLKLKLLTKSRKRAKVTT